MATKKQKHQFKLVEERDVPGDVDGKTERLLTYQYLDYSLSFRWHSTRPFTFVVAECINLTNAQRNKLLRDYEGKMGTLGKGVEPPVLEL